MGSSEQPGVAWVKPPEPIRGLDHLGVQAQCIALYGQLLPGITNVTDRSGSRRPGCACAYGADATASAATMG